MSAEQPLAVEKAGDDNFAWMETHSKFERVDPSVLSVQKLPALTCPEKGKQLKFGRVTPGLYFKACNEDGTCVTVTKCQKYLEGGNVFDGNFESILCLKNGFHFARLESVLTWAENLGYDYLWDVVGLGENVGLNYNGNVSWWKGKTDGLWLTNFRSIDNFLNNLSWELAMQMYPSCEHLPVFQEFVFPRIVEYIRRENLDEEEIVRQFQQRMIVYLRRNHISYRKKKKIDQYSHALAPPLPEFHKFQRNPRLILQYPNVDLDCKIAAIRSKPSLIYQLGGNEADPLLLAAVKKRTPFLFNKGKLI